MVTVDRAAVAGFGVPSIGVRVSDPGDHQEPQSSEHAQALDAPRPTTRRHRVRRWIAVVSALVVVVALALAVFLRLPYYMISPGSSRAVEGLITVQGAPTYDTDGQVDFLTVSLKQATAAELAYAWFDSAIEVRSKDELFGTQSESENHAVNVRMMSDSKDAATYQALTRLGYDITSTGTGAVVASVQANSPATGHLAVGDVVVAIGGDPVTMNDQLVARVRASKPGEVLDLTVEALDHTGQHQVAVTVGARPDDPALGYLGVSTFTRDLTFDFPVTVGINSGQVSGPSAGLAFTLGLLDVLSPGSLTGGAHVAATGTMDLDGHVGPVGGVHQKVVAARRAGATLMLVPSSELEEARRYADSLRIEPADTLDEALAVLTTLGGGDSVLPAPVVPVPVP